jgi:hypothetical protein
MLDPLMGVDFDREDRKAATGDGVASWLAGIVVLSMWAMAMWAALQHW